MTTVQQNSRMGGKPSKSETQGLKCVREKPVFVTPKSDSGRWREDGFIQKQQVAPLRGIAS